MTYDPIRDLSIDVETFSRRPLGGLTGVGAYKYMEDDEFDLLLFSYSINYGRVYTVDIANGERVPEFILEAMEDPHVIKHAHNAAFEIEVCRQWWARFRRITGWARQWVCTMIKSAMAGFPMKLEQVASALRLTEQKLKEGADLIKYFCTPCRPTKVNGQRIRNMPWHDWDRWKQFKGYNAQDVRTEQAIDQEVEYLWVSPKERAAWILDQKINARGVLVDLDLATNAVDIDRRYNSHAMRNARRLTGLDNPGSDAQMKRWLSDRLDRTIFSLTKDSVKDLLAQDDLPKIVRRALEARKDLKKTSIKKFNAMLRYACADGRIRGAHQHYGANRTGRWAGRGVQVQNLRKNDLPDLAMARELVKEGNLDLLMMLFPSVADVLSQLIRTGFIARPGHRFIVNDFASIEARVLAWLAGETWRLKVFRTHGKIYEASAAAMFGIPIEDITKGSPWRQKGKVAELAFGYQGGVKAAIKMGAKRDGLSERELEALVAAWRAANRNIVAYWAEVEKAAIRALQGRTAYVGPIKFHYDHRTLWITLPSGRKLAYYRARLVEGRFGKPAIRYWGVDQKTKQWAERDTYGGSLVENIVQGIARDLLRDAMLEMDRRGYNIVLHVHDETICEEKYADVLTGKSGGRQPSVEEINLIMKNLARPDTIYAGLPLDAEGYETEFYQKDSN